MTLDVKAKYKILRVKDVIPSGIMLLELKDGQEYEEHSKNCTPDYLPSIDGTLHPELAVIFLVLFVVRRKVRQLCYCVTCANRSDI